MKITPRFLTRDATKYASFRHVEPVECAGLFVLSGNQATGEVTAQARFFEEGREKAVWVSFTPGECEQMHEFAQQLKNKQPRTLSSRHYEWVCYSGGSVHKIIQSGWYGPDNQWHNAGEPSCVTCSLPAAVAELVKTMARLSFPSLSFDNGSSSLNWLV